MDAKSFLQNGSDSHASVHDSLMRHLGCEDPARRSMPSWRLRFHHGPYLRHPELARRFSGPKTAVNSGSACRRTASTNTALRALETFRGQNGISMQSIWQQCIERKTSWTAAGCALKDRRMLFGSTDQDKAGNCRACSTQSQYPNWLCCFSGWVWAVSSPAANNCGTVGSPTFSSRGYACMCGESCSQVAPSHDYN